MSKMKKVTALDKIKWFIHDFWLVIIISIVVLPLAMKLNVFIQLLIGINVILLWIVKLLEREGVIL